MIPVAGWFSTGAKAGYRAATSVSGRPMQLKYFVDSDGIISFGESTYRRSKQLGRIIGVPPNHQAHHIIPWEHRTNAIVQQAAKAKNNPFHMNQAENGIAIHKDFHAGDTPNAHPNYNNYMRQRLDQILSQYGVEMSPQTAVSELNDLMAEIRQKILNNSTTHVDDLY